MTTPFWQHAETWAQRALESGWVEKWVEGAIFPREMVAFLATCEEQRVVDVVESGRQDAYSTLILADYARAHAGRLVSIDLELDAERDLRGREPLQGFAEVKFCKGDATRELGRQVAGLRGPTAVLIDGPKHLMALTLNFAAASFPAVRVVAQHNLIEGAQDRALFAQRARSAVFYEDMPGTPGPYWDKLTAAETSHCVAVGAARSLERSSLGIAVVQDRRRLMRTVSPRLGFSQPALVALCWRLGWFGAVPRLFRGSARAAALVRRR